MERRRTASLVVAVFMLLVFGAIAAARTDAAYEQAKEGSVFLHFGVSGEAAQLAKAKGLAINESGVGGVRPGSFYVVGENNRVVRFAPGKEGEEPRFEEAWGWGIAKNVGLPGFERCGPAVAAHPECEAAPVTGVANFGGEQPGNFNAPGGVAVDQTTGDVYVRNINQVAAGQPVRAHHLIEVFTAKGEPVGEGFGDSANLSSSPPESIGGSPEKIHRMEGGAPIAVDGAGTVYIVDADFPGVEGPKKRVMIFKPCSAEDYESYCYATGTDIPLQGFESIPLQMSLVGNNRIVLANESLLREYPLGVSNPPPICSNSVTGQLLGMTANSATGEVFYWTFAGHSLRIFEPCNEATGVFHEAPPKLIPQPVGAEGFSVAMAVNPSLAWGTLRPTGILYAADGNGIGDVFVHPVGSVAPTVGAEATTGTTATSTTLTARIDPSGSTTGYRFEYLSEAEYLFNGESFEGPNVPQIAPVSGEGQIGGVGMGLATAGVGGLAPDTEYRFRVIARSHCKPSEPLVICKGEGAAASLRTYATAPIGLPDGRAYELVSPAEKHGGEIFPAQPTVGSCSNEECKPPGSGITTVYPMQSGPGGDSVTYMGYPFSPTEGSAVFNSYVSSRSGSGWQTAAMSPALLATKGGQTLAYSVQLTEDIIQQRTPQLAPQAPAGYENLYLQRAADPGSLTPLVTAAPPHRGSEVWAIKYGGHSPNFEAQFFAANDALTQETPHAPEPPLLSPSESDLYEWNDGVLSLVNVLPGNGGVAAGATFASASPDAHGVSANGRRVFWQANGNLYVREDGQITREIGHPSTFVSASESGLEVLLSDGCLYSLLTESCTDLTQGEGGFLGIAGQSDDLSRIYFVDSAVLAGSGQPGKPNLYFYEVGVGTRFVATLVASDGAGVGGRLNDWALRPSARTAEASADGRYLAFGSTASLTGYENVGLCERIGNAAEGFKLVAAPCGEVFLYDSTTGRVTCASCDPTGEAPLGISTLRRIEDAQPSTPQPRYLTDQGRLVFDSQDRLSPRDNNGRVEDVYESEPNGVGSCGQGRGCVSLISRGAGSVDSNFLAMEESGANVFFTTREQLVPSDTDELIDLYDAREGGGFSSESEGRPAECKGEACQPPQSPPTTLAPSSQLFAGSGNVKPKKAQKCSKGKVKKNGRCVKQKDAKKQRKRSANRKRGGVK